jgi:hypothetical protein
MHLRLWAPAVALLLLAIAAAGTTAEQHADKKRDVHHDDHHGKKDDHHDHHGKSAEHHTPAVHAENVPETAESREASHDEEQERLIARLNHLTARLQHIDDELEKRLDPKTKIKALSLLHRLEEIEPDTCDKDHYQCGGFEPECVSRLFVCDGVKDCHNEADEEHCDLPTKVGDTFVGHVVFDHCSQRKPENFSITITAVKHEKFFTAFPALRADIHIKHDDHGVEGEVVLPTVGYYRFATSNLILLPPEDDHLGLIGDFDGYNFDRFVGNLVKDTSLEPCGQFIFHREVYDDDHEHESRH